MSTDDDEFRVIIQQAMATEESQRLLKRWDRMWYGVPKQQRANADLLERYEWMYGRSMGIKDELLQRLRASAAMESGSAPEYRPELERSSSTGMLSNTGVFTPETGPHARLSSASGLETSASEALVGFYSQFVKRNESSNSWRFRIWPTLAAEDDANSSNGAVPSLPNEASFEPPFLSGGLDAAAERRTAPEASTSPRSSSKADAGDGSAHSKPPSTATASSAAATRRNGSNCASSGLLSMSVRACEAEAAREARGARESDGKVTERLMSALTTASATPPAATAARTGKHSLDGASLRKRAAADAAPAAPPARPAPRESFAAEERYQRDAWNWRFTRKWITERNRGGGAELDDEGRAFRDILAGESDIAAVPIAKRGSRPSGGVLSRAPTLSDSLLFPAEQSASGAGLHSQRTSYTNEQMYVR